MTRLRPLRLLWPFRTKPAPVDPATGRHHATSQVLDAAADRLQLRISLYRKCRELAEVTAERDALREQLKHQPIDPL